MSSLLLSSSQDTNKEEQQPPPFTRHGRDIIINPLGPTHTSGDSALGRLPVVMSLTRGTPGTVVKKAEVLSLSASNVVGEDKRLLGSRLQSVIMVDPKWKVNAVALHAHGKQAGNALYDALEETGRL
eukprot:PhF_6_TR9738/c0_g1_i1/m.15002